MYEKTQAEEDARYQEENTQTKSGRNTKDPKKMFESRIGERARERKRMEGNHPPCLFVHSSEVSWRSNTWPYSKGRGRTKMSRENRKERESEIERESQSQSITFRGKLKGLTRRETRPSQKENDSKEYQSIGVVVGVSL